MRKFPLSELVSVIKYPLAFLIICWITFISDYLYDLNLYLYGVSPRTISGLKGILFSPFIHGDFGHIINNSLPVLILSSMIFYFYKTIAWPSIIWIYFISGIWLWVGGRNNDIVPNYHFGASTLIYGFASFLFFSGVFRKHKQLMMVSAFVVFMYGSITHGIFPFDTKISWEGHLFGAISGVFVAYSYRKDGPQPIEYQWPKPEEEIDLEAIANQQLFEEPREAEMLRGVQNNKSSLDSFHFVYHYKESEDSASQKEKE
jgi:membrane associated rhomboid family serine protease